MKKILVLLALSLSVMISAQEKLEEGVLITKMTMSSDDEQMNAQIAMVGEIETTTYFKDLKTRVEANNPMTGEMISITDAETKQLLLLMNNPMAGKMYSKSSIEPSEADLKSVNVKEGTETKNILGYDCKQFFVTLSVQGQDMEMELFATNAFKPYSQQTATFADKINGFPLYTKVTMSQGPAKMIIEGKTIDIKKEPVSDDKFDMTPPKGYQEVKQ